MVDPTAFKAELEAELEAKAIRSNEQKLRARQHGEEVLEPFVRLAKAAREVAPSKITIDSPEVNEFGTYVQRVVVLADTIELLTAPHSTTITIGGLPRHLASKLQEPNHGRRKVLTDFSLQSSQLNVPVVRVNEVAEVFATFIKEQLLR